MADSIVVSKPNFACRRIFNNDQIIERFDNWLLICGKAANTRINYTFTARQFAKFLDKPLTAATKEDVRAFLFHLYGRNLAPTTIQSRLDALRVLFDCLQLGGQVRASVPRFLLRRKLPKRLPAAKSEEEIERLIAAANSARDRAAVELGYASGLRAAELVKLNVEDVNLRARSLIVRQGKGGDDRIALFGRRAAAALREYLGDRETGPLFVSQRKPQRGGVTRGKDGDWWGQWRERDSTGKLVTRNVRLGDYEITDKERAQEALASFLKDNQPKRAAPSLNRLSKKGLYNIITKTAKRAGIADLHPHTLRHSMATHCVNRGMGIRFVQELLGHTSLMATQKYLHSAIEDLKRVHTKFLVRG